MEHEEGQAAAQSKEEQPASLAAQEHKETEPQSEEAVPKKEQKPEKYMALLLADRGEGLVKKYFFSERALLTAVITAAVLLVLTVVSVAYGNTAGNQAREENAKLREQIAALTSQNSQISEENAVLNEKILLLSETVSQKVQAEADAVEKAIPDGFPILGMTQIIEETAESDEETGEGPGIVFLAEKGNSVIAAGSGTIASILEHETWGQILQIDHGNGYISVYKVDEKPKVKASDEITKGTLLFEITETDRRIGYQLMQDGNYINPLDLMEISG